MGEGWALILGVTGGTGAAVARAVANDPGLDVFGVHRGNHPGAALELAAALGAAGREARFLLSDAGTAASAESGARHVLESLGPRSVKLFVHSIANASVGKLVAGPNRLHSKQILHTFEAMAHSFVFWTQELVSLDLLAPGARILALSNPMDDAVVSGTAAIAATKAALGAYVRHLAHELGPLGHRVNLLKFGAVTTDAVRRTFGDDGFGRLCGILETAIPAQRLCTVDEVGRFVGVLTGDAGAWFNGATIDFTGGEFQGLMNVLLARR